VACTCTADICRTPTCRGSEHERHGSDRRAGGAGHAGAAAGRALRIVGGDTKAWLGEPCTGERLDLSAHRGIVHYAPEELVLSARAGTPLRDIEDCLAERGQILAFEPPHLGAAATLGGTLACGLSGPRRVAAGAARDFVLGVRILDGRGRVLRFGGEVIKNVAGYDLSRLMVGAHGGLGVILEASLKVLPRPMVETTRVLDLDAAAAVAHYAGLAAQPWPLSAGAWMDGRFYLRLSGSADGVAAAIRHIGGEELPEGARFWSELREQRLAFFDAPRIWRLSLPPAAPSPALDGVWLLDWGGAQRWLAGAGDGVHQAASALGGHAVLWRGAVAGEARRAPLPTPLFELHQRLKAALDPAGILNPGVLYPGL
jgi:FAD/FMN-containing dehydrogenases